MENKSSGGVGLSTLLLVLFVGLKLTGYINWSWWWVLSPFWIPLIFVIVVLGIAKGVEDLKKERG